jgi:hypothetical protein
VGIDIKQGGGIGWRDCFVIAFLAMTFSALPLFPIVAVNLHEDKVIAVLFEVAVGGKAALGKALLRPLVFDQRLQ